MDSRTFSLLVWTAVLVIPTSTMSQPLSEYDTGWHLRTGQWIAEHGWVPTHDTFSTIGPEQPWIAYSWLYGLALHALVEHTGFIGILWFRTIMGVAITLALVRLIARREPRLAMQAAITAAATIALIPLLVSERPGLFSILGAIWTLEAILSLREGRASWRTWLLPLVYTFWASSHIQFVHGLFLLGLAWLAPILDHLLGRDVPGDNAGRFTSSGWWKLTLLGILCGLATLVNPYHVRLYEVVLTYAQQTETYHLFAELHAPAFRQPADWVLLALLVASAFVLGKRGSFSSFEVLLLASGTCFAFHARHDVWLLVLAACVVLVGSPRSQFPDAPRGKSVLLTIALAIVVFGRFAFQDLSEVRLFRQLAKEFPLLAVNFIQRSELPGPICNPIDWGGFLIWHLPDHRVGIDGRAQLHGGPRIERFMNTWKGLPGWSDDPELNKASMVLMQRTAPLTSLLRLDSRFRLVYEDDLAVVFARE